MLLLARQDPGGDDATKRIGHGPASSDVGRGQVEHALHLERRQLRMLRQDERAERRDVRRREAVARAAQRAAAGPGDLDVDAAREELDGRRRVGVEEARIVLGRGCPPRSPTRSATDSSRPACCGPRRRARFARSTRESASSWSTAANLLFVVERLMLITSKPCSTAQRSPRGARRRSPCSPCRARARCAGCSRGRALGSPRRTPFRARRDRPPRRRRPRGRPPSGTTVDGLLHRADERMARARSPLSRTQTRTPAPVEPPNAHSGVDPLGPLQVDRDPLALARRQAPRGQAHRVAPRPLRARRPPPAARARRALEVRIVARRRRG